jgi:hypothetical protein
MAGLYDLTGLDTSGCKCRTILRAEEVAILANMANFLKLDRAVLVTVCSWCNKIRDPYGEWLAPETFFFNNFGGKCTHTICEECRDRFFPDFSSGGSEFHHQLDTA